MKTYTDAEALLLSTMDNVLGTVEDAIHTSRGEQLPELVQEVKAVCDKMEIKKERDEFLTYIRNCKDVKELKRLSRACAPSYLRFRVVDVLMDVEKEQEVR